MKHDYTGPDRQPVSKWRLTFEVFLEPVEVVEDLLAERSLREHEVSAVISWHRVRGHQREQPLPVRAVEEDSLA